MSMWRVTAGLALVAAVTASACGARASEAPQRVERTTAWRRVGSWSGHGGMQTESFTSDTGVLRVRWQTNPQPGFRPGAPAVFRLTAHSAISGRVLQQVVDASDASDASVADGVGNGVGYVQQDPHTMYMVVESSQADWKFTVEEAIAYP